MTTSKKDAQDAIFAGQALAGQAFEEFLKDWNLPSLVEGMRPMWMQLSPEQKEKLKEMNPELYQRMSDIFAAPG